MADKNRDNGGKFLKGHKGFKPKGRETFTKLRKALKGEEDELIKATIENAKAGNAAALGFLLRKMYGDSPISNFSLQGQTIVEVSESLLANVGNVDPAVLANASRLLESHIKVIEAADFEARLQELENAK